jgi:hypothetical protein
MPLLLYYSIILLIGYMASSIYVGVGQSLMNLLIRTKGKIMLKKIPALALTISFMTSAVDNIVLVTLDGVRWQEVFQGAELSMIENKEFVSKTEALKHDFWAEDVQERRNKLMPFFWQTIVKQGSVIGDREQGSNMSVSNLWYFSYPGYSEILTGITDPKINSNKKINNSNVTILEWLNNKPKYKNKVAAFASWDVFPSIINTERSKLPVNAGFDKITETDSYSKLLNQLQDEIPSPWHNVRLDAFTYRFAKQNLLTNKPKVTYIALGETDDFAHDGHYDQYLHSIKRSDDSLKDLWETIQSTPGYKDNTVMLILTDHGRGSTAKDWQHHASVKATTGPLDYLKNFTEGIVGSNHIWFAAIGPGVKSAGIIKTPVEIKQGQVAATILSLLGEEPDEFNPAAGKTIDLILSNPTKQ